MGLGGSIALIAIGLILALAVNINIAGLDVHLIGWILAAVGVLGLVHLLRDLGPRRRAATTVQRAGVRRPARRLRRGAAHLRRPPLIDPL